MQRKLPFSIFQYSSYLEFFQDSYEFLHSQDETISYEKIAEACGFKTRSEARSLIKGSKKPSETQFRALASYLGLSEEECQYLLCLGRFQEAGGSFAAYELFQKLVALQKAQKNTGPMVNPFREIEVATSVLHMTLLSALELPGVCQDAESLSTLLKGRYAFSEISRALIELEECGYIARIAGNDGWVLSQKHIKKFDYNVNFFLRSFHSQCLELAKDSLDREPPSERYLVGASFCINGKVFSRIVQKMNAFVENLMHLEGVAGSPDTIVQFNQQLVKMSHPGHAALERGLGHTAERGLGTTENPVIA